MTKNKALWGILVVSSLLAGAVGWAQAVFNQVQIQGGGADSVPAQNFVNRNALMKWGPDTLQNSSGVLQWVSGSSTWDLNPTATLTTVYPNAVASAATYGYHKAARAFTVTEIGMGVSSVASGAGNTVLQISDGTNTCQATYSCTADSNSTGGKNNAVAASAGTCTMLANTSLTISVASTNCGTTQPTIKNLWIGGTWQ